MGLAHSRSRPPRRVVLLALLLVLIPLSASCSAPTEARSPVHIRMSGSSSVANLVSDAAVVYHEDHPNVTLHTSVLNSQQGLQAVLLGKAEIGLVSRPLRKAETQSADTGEPRVTATSVGHDGVAVIVNAANPVVSLSAGQLRSIYTGEVWTWPDVGGAEGEITVVTREEGSGTREVFEAAILRGARLAPGAIIMPSTSSVASYVQGHAGAIGYLSAAASTDDTKTLRIDGQLPHASSLKNGRYPILRPFYLVVSAQPSTDVLNFVGFVARRGTQTLAEPGGPR